VYKRQTPNYEGLNIGGGTASYSFTTVAPSLGSAYEGGYFICASGGVRWVVAPISAQVCRSWHSRNDANTTAQSISGCSGWFVPTCGQLQNPGHTCITYWDAYSNIYYGVIQSSMPAPLGVCTPIMVLLAATSLRHSLSVSVPSGV